MDSIYDAVVVGAGPAGLSASLVLARCRRKIIVFDAGQPRNAAARAIHGYLGHDGIAPLALLEQGRAEIAAYGVVLVHDRVISARKFDPSSTGQRTLFRVVTEKGQSIKCRKLLLATGTCDELPEFAGVRECYGVSVHHCPYCDGYEHRDQKIAVYGKQPQEGVGLALAVRGWSDRVTVLTDGKSVTAEDRHRLGSNGIALCEQRIIRLVHHEQQLSGIELEGGDVLAADALFFETIQHSSCDLPAMLGIECDGGFAGRTSRKQKTNVPGVFLAGDADGNVEFVVVAAAEGATAAVAINRELQDEDRTNAVANPR